MSFASIVIMIIFPDVFREYFLYKSIFNLTYQQWVEICVLLIPPLFVYYFIRFGIFGILAPFIFPFHFIYIISIWLINAIKKCFKSEQYIFSNAEIITPPRRQFKKGLAFAVITFFGLLGLLLATEFPHISKWLLSEQFELYVFTTYFPFMVLFAICSYLFIDVVILQLVRRQFIITKFLANRYLKFPLEKSKSQSRIIQLGKLILNRIHLGDQGFSKFLTKLIRAFIGFYLYYVLLYAFFMITGSFIGYYINVVNNIFTNGLGHFLNHQLLAFFSSFGLLPILVSFIKNTFMRELRSILFTVVCFFGGIKLVSVSIATVEQGVESNIRRELAYVSDEFLQYMNRNRKVDESHELVYVQ
jgi:hypothetical protein